MYPYNHKLGQKIQTDVPGVSVDRAFLAHFQVAAAAAVAASNVGIHALMNLGAAAQQITAGIANPAVPRNASIIGNVAGINGKVKVYGTNFANEAISEELTANGTTAVVGNLAFKTITRIDLPAQVHSPAAQTETQQITHKADAAGTITIAVTAAALGDASPKSVAVEVALDDTAAEVAALIVAALNDDEDVSAHFTASVTGAGTDTVTLTANTPLANDATLAMAFTDTDTTGVTAGASTNGTTGVPYDKISVGWGDKLGLPYLLQRNTLLYKQTFLNNVIEGTEPTVATSASAIESNTIILNSALDGTQVDAYFVV